MLLSGHILCQEIQVQNDCKGIHWHSHWKTVGGGGGLRNKVCLPPLILEALNTLSVEGIGESNLLIKLRYSIKMNI